MHITYLSLHFTSSNPDFVIDGKLQISGLTQTQEHQLHYFTNNLYMARILLVFVPLATVSKDNDGSQMEFICHIV